MRTITLISGTNRPSSYTQKVATGYKKVLEDKGVNVQLLSLTELPADIAVAEVFGRRSGGFEAIIKKYIDNCDSFLFVIPEYNGSFPGIMKLFIDAVHPSKWHDKNACLAGVSTGRAGNLRGMEHLTNILHYLKMHVYHNKLPISQVDKLYAGGDTLPEETQKAIELQIEGFLKFIQ